MPDTRLRNVEWVLPPLKDGSSTWVVVHSALLMDLRDELKALNRLLGCGNFTGIPSTLRGIRNALARRRRRTEKKPRGKGRRA